MFRGSCLHFDIDAEMRKHREEAGGIAGEFRDVTVKPKESK